MINLTCSNFYFHYQGRKYYAFDGCSTNEDVGIQPGYRIGLLVVAQIVCCSLDGSSCTRKRTEDSGQQVCRSGVDGTKKVSWNEAHLQCKFEGKRLCNSQKELNQCCAGGCNYDNQLVWSGVKEGMHFAFIFLFLYKYL